MDCCNGIPVQHVTAICVCNAAIFTNLLCNLFRCVQIDIQKSCLITFFRHCRSKSGTKHTACTGHNDNFFFCNLFSIFHDIASPLFAHTLSHVHHESIPLYVTHETTFFCFSPRKSFSIASNNPDKYVAPSARS